MKRNRAIAVFLVVALLAVASGCVTNLDGSPRWTTKTPTSRSTYYAVGYGKLSNLQNSQIRAEAMAMDKIARWASTTVQGALVNYFADTQGSDEPSYDMMESVSTQIAHVTLHGCQVEDRWIDREGGVWVLVSYPIKNLKEAYKLQSTALMHSIDEMQQELLMKYLDVELSKEAQ